ncbi:restriction endonuclease subunit S [Caviibacterium pharyngocola]|uniref:Type I restriction modification DNA specificity domain-containing protein n=1 Tax=Caviibacterium pharyngocola TaxID=28159 RepID=A0A2M8RU25_9PAST|nr:restriction endonuclease subunit S [Caviibacterium pharyngocola]PJG82400.1 hypothetical protein CVP04_08650 [Caviibacterium pharyngocola]
MVAIANKTIPTIEILLPVRINGNEHQPDWDFMDNYIRSLSYKPLTTKNKYNMPFELNINEWESFEVGRVFQCETTTMLVKDDLSDGNIPFISRSGENNGCTGYVDIDESYVVKGGCLTIGAEGIYSFFQPEDFVTGNKVYTLRNDNLNVYNAMFVSTILNNEYYRFSYGRARILGKLQKEIIKLPIVKNPNGSPLIDKSKQYSDTGYIPDWDFMENYIKSLPYGDRL